MQLVSQAFQNEAVIPERYTADGADVSPPIAWTNVPDGTEQFVLICDDPDAPGATWVHWVLYNVPGNMRALDEHIPREEIVLGVVRQGKNDFHKIGYGGPAPPPGRRHRYFFKLYAVKRPMELPAGLTKAEIMAVIDGHIVGEATLMGTYQR